jgi:lipopolysaccharide biosynthesis regulator YciM
MTQFKNAAAGLVLGALTGAASLGLAPMSSVAADAPKGPQISRSIAKEIIAAQKALQANQFAEGLKQLAAAEAITPLTPFDKKTIDELKAFAYIKTNDFKSADHAYEDALATGAANAEETNRYTRAVFSIAVQTQQWPKAIEFGKKLVEADTANADIYLAVTQSYYLQKDCKDAVVWADKSIAYARVQHETPKENLFLFKLQCAFDNNDNAGTIAALEDLIRLTGKTDYWNKLLRIERQDEREDRNLLMIYRIMYNTNSMNAASDYMEMAQLLGDAALPGEAAVVIDKGLSAGTIGADGKDRATRLLNSVKQRADADKKGLVQFDSEANKSAAGELDVKLGEVYYGFGDYQNAVTAINRGIAKGQVKHLDEAYVYLGLAQVAQKNTADAKKAFAQLKTVPTISPRVLKLWNLYAEKLG